MAAYKKNSWSLSKIACIGTLLILPVQGVYTTIHTQAALAQQQTSQLSQQQLQQLAKSITVKILSGEKGGSGILIRKKGPLFTVITSKHVLEKNKSAFIHTSDGKKHQAELVKGINFDNKDLVLLNFRSSDNYKVAQLGNSSTIKQGDKVFAAGFPFEANASESRQFVFRLGRISLLLKSPLQGGYQIGYTNEVEKGMSGGPIISSQGKVIGINGIHAQPLWGNPYAYEDGTQPSDALQEKMRNSSWGVPIQTVAKLAPQFVSGEIVASDPKNTSTNKSRLQQLSSQIDNIAKEITVLINWGSGNGSGAIVAQQGNTYHVLTAQHVVRGNRTLTITTADGKQHSVNPSQIKILPGVDLALVQFTNSEKYQVANLANYSLDINDRVAFVSGWPVPKAKTQKLSRQFSTGFLLGWNRGTNRAMDDRSFSQGYGLVYTNFTALGMSGGPVLDTEGRLIGIHTAAEAFKKGQPSPIQQKSPRNPQLELGYSLGIPIRTFLAKIEQEKINLNLKPVANSLPKQLTAAEQDEIVQASLNLKPPQSNADQIEWLNYGNELWRSRRYKEAQSAFERSTKIKPDFYHGWYSHGMALMRQEKYPEAIKSFKLANKYNPESDRALRQLGDAYWYSGEYPEALQTFKQTIQLRPDDFILHNWLADAFNQLGRHPEALQAGNQSIQLNPNLAESYIRRSRTRSNLGDYSEAIKDLNKALKLQPDLAIAYVQRALVRYWQKDYQEALNDTKTAIRLQPNFVDAYWVSGLVHAQMNNREGFIKDFNKALQIQPDNAVIYAQRGYAHYLLGDTAKGIADYNDAIRLNSKLAYEFYTQRGDIRWIQKDYNGAVADYTQALSFRSSHVPAYIGRGKAYAKLGKRQQSLQDFNKALSLQPKNSLIYSSRGYSRLLLKDYQAGVEDYNKAIGLTPQLAYLFYNNRGNAQYEQENYKGAIADYTKAISLKPKDAVFYWNRGDVYLTQKQYQQAIADFTAAIRLNPDYASAYNKRGIALEHGKDYKGAIADYTKAISLEPNQGVFYSNRGGVYLTQKQYQQAIDDFTAAIRLNQENASAYSIRAIARDMQEDYKGAIADHTEAIGIKPKEARYYNRRGNTYLKNKEYRKAIADYTTAISLDVDDGDAYGLRSLAYAGLGDKQKAIQDLQKASQIFQKKGNMDNYKLVQSMLSKLQQ
ncbi:trypsin-like serine protease with C-terminal PDZ domain [Rivularia sp. PCC 7116]|uniref:serine protease n=1 Tax=Rivularia sp. PCC 7116 TaxID=373994 RepID=UPI00029ED3EB|nr:serine protease [Rivularia sp. PCC 7116]AFY58437.1 trypsin-like serine protease with C-terminal PDZ domain [Rivularia sp. PCC 7116]